MRYQSTATKRRFLAGVTCPSCASLDKVVQIQQFEPNFDEYIECIICGHQERRPKPEDLKPQQSTNEIQIIRF